MPIKYDDLGKELADFLNIDIEKTESIEDVKNSFNETFAKKEVYKNELLKDPNIAKQVAGRFSGLIETKIRQIAKDNGVEIENSEWKDKSIEDIMDGFSTKIKSKYKEEIESIKKENGDPAEAVKEWETKYNRIKSERDTYKESVKTLGLEYEDYKKTVASNEREGIIKSGKAKAFGDLKLKREATELELTGFRTKIESDYKFDLSEDNKVIITDKEGKPIPNPKKAGSYYEPEELIKEKAIEFNLYETNPNAGKPAQVQTKFVTTPGTPSSEPAEKLMNWRA